jgi:hypothetical protein
VFFGIVLSPVMWLTYYNPMVGLTPMCIESREDGVAPHGRSLDATAGGPQQAWTAGSSWRKGGLERNGFNLSAEGVVLPPSNPDVRHKKMSHELAPRKLLFIGVVTAQKYLDTRAVAINRTWGRGLSDLRFFSSHPKNSSIHLPIITLPGINDTVYPPQRKVYHMLKYMHDHYIDEYDFFMRSDDDVYVKVDLLHELLTTVNPAQDIYMGCPGFGKPVDRDRIKLNKGEHYCMGGPGVIFSRSALRKLAPHLHTCLEVRMGVGRGIEEGRGGGIV